MTAWAFFDRPMVHRSALVAAIAAASLLPAAGAAAAEPGWLTPVTISGAGVVGAPRVAVNPGGDAAVIWIRGGAQPGVFVSIRPSGTVDWPAPQRVSATCPTATPRRCSFLDARVAIDGDGDVAAAWVVDVGAISGPGASVEAAVNVAGGGGWSRSQALSTVLGRRLAVDVGLDVRGTATVVWSDGDDVIRAASRPSAGAWSSAVRLSGAEEGGAPELAVGAGGDALAVWEGDDCRPWAARRPAGGDWQPARPLEPQGSCGDGPAAGVDGAGNAVAAWRHWTGTGRTLRSADLMASDDAWQPATDLGPAAAGALDPPPLAVGASGRAILVWKDETGAVRFASRAAGAGWGAPETVPGTQGAPPSLDFALLPDGGTLVVLGGGAGRPPQAIERAAASGWGDPAPIGEPPARGFIVPAVGADASGNAVAVWAGLGTVVAGELSQRQGNRLTLPTPAVSDLTGPAASAVGALARLRATLDAPGEDVPITVEHLVRGSWVRLATVRVDAVTTVDVPVRLLQPGTERLRARTGGPRGATRASAAITVRVTRPGRPRIAVGEAPAAIALGEGAAWVLGNDGGVGTVRRLDLRTGRPVGRLILVGADPTAIAAGAGAVWVMRDAGELVRIDPVAGTVSQPVDLSGSRLTLTAGPAGVWVGGVCLPSPTPATACSRQVAIGIDPSTGEPNGRQVAVPGAQARGVRLAGSTLWVWGPRRGGGGTVLARAGASTGAVSGSRVLSAGASIVPVSAATAWSLVHGSLVTAWPSRARVLVPRGFRAPAPLLASDGRRAWAVLRGAPGRGVLSERLVSLDPRSGRTVGAALGLGGAVPQAEGLAAGGGVVWLLRRGDGAVIRIPVPVHG